MLGVGRCYNNTNNIIITLIITIPTILIITLIITPTTTLIITLIITHQALRERLAKRELAMFGPALALVKAGGWGGRGVKNMMRVSIALECVYDILEGKYLHDRESDSKNKWSDLTNYAEVNEN
jgi:hypothetical protein